MGGDRRRQRDRSGDDSDDVGRRKHSSSKSNDLPVTERKQSLILPSMIKNKEKRSEIHSKLKHQKKVDKKKKIKARDAAEKRAVELGEEPPARQIPRTIEKTREADETVCKPDDEEGIFGSGFCYVGISWCIEQRGAVFTAAFSPFVQIFVMILDLAFFHERIFFGSVIGSTLVVCGLYTLLWGKSNEAVGNMSKRPETAELNGIAEHQ